MRLPAIAGLAAVAALATAASAHAAPTAAFDWSMDRTVSHGNDRVFGVPAKTATFAVNLDACASRAGASPIASYVWRVGDAVKRSTSCRLTRPPAQPLPAKCARHEYADDSSCNPDGPYAEDPRFRLPEGSHPVTLEVTDGAGATTTTTRTVTVKNTLMVAIGDSFFSGEGNPDQRGSMGVFGYSGDEWLNRQCHRSAKSAPVFVARELERSDPRSSVTFKNLACSGAEIDTGLLGPYDGITGGDDLPAQVDELRSLLCRNVPAPCMRHRTPTIDHLVVSIGINDVNFSSILKTCALFGDHCRPVARPDFERGYRRLSDGYRRLATALGALPISRISIVEYPSDPFQERVGRWTVRGGCGAMRGISGAEADWLAQLGVRLRLRMQDNARRYGWGFVAGSTDAFRGHGYCHGDSWYRTMSESIDHQGDENGTMHPDGSGHGAIARLLIAALRAPGPTPNPPPSPGNPGYAQGPTDVAPAR